MVSAALITLLFLLASSAPSRAEGDGQDEIEVDCFTDLLHSRRPMLTEKEIKTFKKCWMEAADDDADFEYVEVLGQGWDAGAPGSTRRRLAGTTNVKSRMKCTDCGSRLVPSGAEGGRRLDQDAALGDSLLACFLLATKKDDLEAFADITAVEASCTLVVHAPPISDVLGENDGTRVEEEQICQTAIENAQAPMLSEPEMAHYDSCYINMYNEYHSIGGGPFMIENEIVAQKLTGDLDYTGAGRRLKTSGNTILSAAGTCRRCPKPTTSTRRDRHRHRALQELPTFDQSLCACLSNGADHLNNNASYAAFKGDIVCTIECGTPTKTQEEFETMLKEQSEFFETNKERMRAAFERKYDAEKKRLEDAEIELEKTKDVHDYEEKVQEILFEKYQYIEQEKYKKQITQGCSRIVKKTGCDDIKVPPNMVSVKESGEKGAKITVKQDLNRGASGFCPEDDDDKVYFLAQIPKEDGDYDCKGEEKKCGDEVGYEAKGCDWDPEWMKAAAEVHLMISKRGKVDGYDCEGAIRDAEEKQDFCHLVFQVDCGCETTVS